ncbi:QRFP-like peptide receptor [Lytechinus variegatus]|uniref:QRFP-like peptide receptor n=1 Tax=Lytechinus variegatus TaxID=7654 RepID=UPI001BB22E3B|nr:QRFP-like peptide receptor [Lytechinus variegatus]
MTTEVMKLNTTTVAMNQSCLSAGVTAVDHEDCAFIGNVTLAFIVISIILIIFGLFNNILLVVIILSNGSKLRTIPNISIGHMAVLSILYLVIVSGGNLLTFGQIAFQFELSDSVVKVIFFIQTFISVASFSILVLLGFDRYLSIVYPLRSRPYRTKTVAIIINCLVWIVAVLCLVPLFIGHVEVGVKNIFGNYLVPRNRNSMIIFTVITFITPVIALTIMYVAILKTIWFNQAAKHLHGEGHERRWKQRIQVFRSLFKVVFAFVLSYGFFFAVFLWIALGGHTQVSAGVSNLLFYSSLLIVYLNCGINPLIYALTQQAFRPHVYKLLCPKKCRRWKPEKDALYTIQQIDTGSKDHAAPHEGNKDKDFEVEDGHPHIYLNDGYYKNDKAEDCFSLEEVLRSPQICSRDDLQ